MSFPKEKLSNLCFKITDGSHNPPKGIDFSEYLMLSSKNIGNDNLTYESPRYLTKEDFELENRRTQVAPSDVLLTIVGTIGRCAVVPTEIPNICLQRSVAVLKPNHNLILSRFLMYSLMSMVENLNSRARGVAQKGIYLETIRDLEFTIPPISIQHKIVAKLDVIFSEIAKAQSATDINLKNTEAFFQSYLEKIFESKSDDWVTSKLKDICEKITDGTHQTPTYYDDGVIFLSSKNVTTGKIDWDRVKYIDSKQHIEMSKRVSPKVGDVLLAKNGTTGVAAMVDKNVIFNIYVSLALLRAKEQILPKLLLYFVNSPVAKKQFNSRLKGVGVPNLHLQEIREVEISFPKSLDKQRELIFRIESFLDITSLQNIRYKNKKIEISKLNHAILKQAFNGELVKE